MSDELELEWDDTKKVELDLKVPEELELKLEVTHEHEVSFIGEMLLLGLILWVMFSSYDSEIRCALGNKIECAKMEVIQPMRNNQ